jgi:hypothetical protein
MSLLNGVNPEDLKNPFDNAFLRRRPRASVYRWLVQGDLRAVKMGGTWLTTDQWIQDFIEVSTKSSVGQGNGIKHLDATGRKTQIESAENKWGEMQSKANPKKNVRR